MFKLNIPLATVVKVFVLAAFLIVNVNSAEAVANYLQVVNHTGATITGVYVVNNNVTQNWGGNLLSGTIPNGHYDTVRLFARGPVVKCRVTLNNGKSMITFGIDLNKTYRITFSR